MKRFPWLLWAGVVLFPTPAFAAKVYQLSEYKWAIMCDTGVTAVFNGTVEGAAEAAEIICESVGHLGPRGQTVVTYESLQPAVSVLAGNGSWRGDTRPVRLAAGRERAFRGYPPRGYPCIGCEPCPGRPDEFCSTGIAMQVHPEAARAGYGVTAGGRLVRRPARVQGARAWTTPLEGERWAIVCASGVGYDFRGSEAAMHGATAVLCDVPAGSQASATRPMELAERFVVWNERTGRWERR